MPKLTPEVMKKEVVESTGVIPGVKIVRAKGEEDVMYGPPMGMVHRKIAEAEGIKPADVAYAGKLMPDQGPEGGVNMFPGGESIDGYQHNSEEEAMTARTVLNILQQVDENLKLIIKDLY